MITMGMKSKVLILDNVPGRRLTWGRNANCTTIICLWEREESMDEESKPEPHGDKLETDRGIREQDLDGANLT